MRKIVLSFYYFALYVRCGACIQISFILDIFVNKFSIFF